MHFVNLSKWLHAEPQLLSLLWIQQLLAAMYPLLRTRLSKNLNMEFIANICIIILLTQVSWADFWFQHLPENKEQFKKCMQFYPLYRFVCLDES